MKYYQVCDRGNQVSLPTFSIQKRCGPLEPISSANPPTGTRQVPVTNCNRRARFSLSVSRTN